LGLLCSCFSSSAPRTPPWGSSTVEFMEQVLLHKKCGVGGVPLEVLQEKRGVGLQLHVFLGAEFVELHVFGTVELERSWKNGSRAVPNTPLVFRASFHCSPRCRIGLDPRTHCRSRRDRCTDRSTGTIASMLITVLSSGAQGLRAAFFSDQVTSTLHGKGQPVKTVTTCRGLQGRPAE
jgi:hypothetical protein